MVGPWLALLCVSSIWLVTGLFILQSASWAFYPVLLTISYELKEIRPREIAIAISTLFTALWVGAVIGPVISGAIQELFGDLRLVILLTSLAPISLTLCGAFLSRNWDAPPNLVLT